MLRREMTRGRAVARSGQTHRISSYDEYLKLYFPDDFDDVTRSQADPAEVGEQIGRRAVERAVARLTSDNSD